MSEATYRRAANEFRIGLAIVGRPRGACGLCGHPDARHRTADAVTERLLAGEEAATVGGDYGLPASSALELAVYALAADPRRHGISRARADAIDQAVWADA
jgi:hypothetical protein